MWTTLEGFAPLKPGTIEWGPLEVGDVATLPSPPWACYTLAWQVGAVDRARSRLPYGQSENARSTHYLDQQPLWTQGDLKSAPTPRAGVEALGVESVTPLEVP